MNRKLIEELHQYFVQKESKNSEEANFLSQLTEELSFFQIAALSREDLQRQGFDITNVDDDTMRQLSADLCDNYCEQLFWDSMEIIADQRLDIPRHICPRCGNGASQYDSHNKTYYCAHCSNEWEHQEPTGRYVKVEFPEDSKFFMDCEVGYDCCNSEDNGAMYVPENFYVGHVSKEPETNNVFIPVVWPESQRYFELQHQSESTFALCEPIEHGKAFDDFGSQAIWVPLCYDKQAHRHNN